MEQQTNAEPIAIIGWSCRFPGESSSPSKLWNLLSKPRDVRKEFDSERLNLSRFYNQDGDIHGATNVKNQGYLLAEDSRLFDPAFFGISPVEAEGMDPQQRILLEAVFETFEAAGYSLDQMRNSKTSVHVGVMTGDYSDIQMRDTETVLQHCATGTSRSILSNRISYIFDLHGPSVTIDTACSSSLVAIHQGIQAMQAGDCETAIVGGVNLILDPSMYIIESKLHMLSPDSQSRMWSNDANGYARGEGVAAILLKPLSRALKDNDDIKAIIRGTGVNSDGRSQGITKPRASAQAALIRDTYRKAGLDPIKDRPQYFECHGTGTTAGDPVEARAIFEALIEEPRDNNDDSEDIPHLQDNDDTEAEGEPLYVGSIKTVIGHLEGCAGLAGLIKAVLAISHRTIPPNMLFKELNPKIQPFYGKIKLPTAALPWPTVAAGQPLRASINSFGFGGTNAHAIVESYDIPRITKTPEEAEAESQSLVGPFTLSGFSGSSLRGNAEVLLQHLVDHPNLNLHHLAWVLQCRRSAHRAKTYFVADSREKLIERLTDFVADNRDISKTEEIGIRSQFVNPSEVPGILGVFTGQGAQWSSMGRGLLHRSPLFRKSLENCEAALNALSDGPAWSLVEELQAGDAESRLAEAELSQPLCTAVQIGLVDVLYASGIQFAAVVGHSSGEIAAVYACGMISLPAAMQIAYYRGKWAKLASGPNGESGAMIAVAISLDEAESFCALPAYDGQLCVAASNAPQSVTLSGNLEAVQRAQEHFTEESIFNRLLKVDTAYHSHHMQRCASKYLESLVACDIQVSQPQNDCIWNSSVRGDTELLHGDLQSLKDTYWVQNMVQAVLFQQAIKSALWHGGPFDLAIEVGPHPALKGPTEQTLKSAFGTAPFHTGVLRRGGNDVEAFSGAIGFCWSYLGHSAVDFNGFRRAFGHNTPDPSALQNLPPYSWDHNKVYWRESRISKRFRKSADYAHELLGRRTADDTEREMRWRNVLKASELPWVKGHEVLGQALLPGASYVSLAFEAGKCLAAGRPVRLLEIVDMDIRRPVLVPSTNYGIETVFTTHLLETDNSEVLEADFSYYYCPDERVGSMVHTCNGRLKIYLGSSLQEELPQRGVTRTDLLPVNVDDMYQLLHDTGLNYTGMFRRLQQAQRKLDYAFSTATWDLSEFSDSYVAHPAVIDVCFQSLFVARSSPDAGHLPSTPLPVHIGRVVLDPNAPWATKSGAINLNFESFITKRDGSYLNGDLHIYDSESGQAILQVEALVVKPVSEPTKAQDKDIFSNITFYADPSWSLIEQKRNTQLDEKETALAADVERVSLYYMQRLVETIDPSQRSGLKWYHQRMIEAFECMIDVARSGQHPHASTEWLNDGPEILDAIYAKRPDQIDLIACRLVGENILSVVRGEMQILELLMEDDVLERVYMGACGWTIMVEALTATMKQLSHKFPRADILEIGAGTGGTTWTVFQTISDAVGTYTFTDISTGFFEAAAKKFNDYRDKMIFKSLDIGNDVESQDFQKGSYDIVVATNVLHATPQLGTTLENTRSLLKPGGFLVLVETTGVQIMRTPFIMAGMPGWYLGADDGRRLHPGIPTEEWDYRLNNSGFSGVDMVFYDSPEYEKHSVSLMVSQAVNDTLIQLRDPLSSPSLTFPDSTLLIIGGKTLPVSKLVRAIQSLLRSTRGLRIKMAADVEAVDFTKLSRSVDVICLQELDKPLFSSAITEKTLKALQNLFLNCKNMLWVTQNRRSGNPRSNMMLGVMRTLFQELPQVNTQMLDLDAFQNTSWASRTVAKVFMRLEIYSLQKHDEEKLLWAQESELVADGDHMLIPRVIPDEEINARYNANYRTVTRYRCSSTVPARITARQNKLALVEDQSAVHCEHGNLAIKVDYSLCIPAQFVSTVYYLSVGHVVDSGSPVIALSEVNASIIRVPHDKFTPIEEKHVNPITLEAVATQILAQVTCSLVSKGHSALFCDMPETLATIVSEEFGRHETEVFFASSRAAAPASWINFHPQSSLRSLRASIPRNVALYVNSSDSSSQTVVSLQHAFPQTCQTLESGVLQQRLASAYSALPFDTIYASVQGFLDKDMPRDTCCKTLDVDNLVGYEATLLGHSFITSWQTTGPLDVILQPADRTGIFDPAKTYLMVGMAGGLGLSICGWALQHGGKTLVITSRNPNIPAEWLQTARLQGADIHVHKMDVSRKSSVQVVVDTVRKTLPPVAGVCNAAMVLQDKLFIDMDAESMNKCLRPKVDGTQHLHDVFADTHLDFFILLGSGATIIGNPGQSNYHAANEFMVAMADMRRKQGLAASIIHIGAVIDVGYVTRQSGGVKAAFQSLQIPFISETDVHYAFAEAVLAGKPDSNRGFETAVGIDRIKKHLDIDERPAWLTDPRCSHLTPLKVVKKEERINSSSQVNIKKLIETTQIEDEAIPLLQDACCAKLESMMQLPAGSIDIHRSLIDLGIDSLVAVEVRMWFLKELGTDIPVLKILGGDSVAQICVTAAKQVLAKRVDTTPNYTIQEDSAESSTDDSSSEFHEPLEQASLGVGDMRVCTPTTPLSIDSDEEDSKQLGAKVESENDEIVKDRNNTTIEEDPVVGQLTRKVVDEGKMSGAQSRIWVLSKYLKDPTAYNLAFLFRLTGELDIDRLRSALMITMQHHQSLRTCFYSRGADGQPMQGILNTPVSRFEPIQNATEKDTDKAWTAAKTKIWDIENGEAMGVTVLSSGTLAHTIIFAYHHIFMDAVSWRVFLQDLNKAYQMRPLKHRGHTYIDYTKQQLNEVESGTFKIQLQYWLREYRSIPQVLPLMPMAKTQVRSSTPSTKTHYAWREIDKTLSAKIKKACHTTRSTPFHFHLAIIQALFTLSLSIDEICIGMADANRIDGAYAETIGFFVNLLPLRFQLSKDVKFSQLVQNTSRKVFTALENSAVPFNTILDHLKIIRSSSHTPLFQVAVNYRNGSVREVPLGNNLMVMSDVQDAKNPYDISFGIVEANQDLSMVEVTFQESLFDEDACQTILDTYMRLVETFATNPSCFIKDCEVYDPKDVSKAIALGRGPQIEFDWPPTLSQRFTDICRTYPEKTAIIDKSRSIDYAELESRVHSLAVGLQNSGCARGSRIAVLCEPSADFVTSLLAILHIGGVYVPLDVSLPSSRHEDISQACKPSLILCHAATEHSSHKLAEQYRIETLSVDKESNCVSKIPCAADAGSPAILLFTSGSTGKPKGVILSQANFANHVALKTKALGLAQGVESVLQQSSLGFDMSLIQIFCAIANGGALVIAPYEARWDPVHITNLMLQHSITLTIATPSEYMTWLQYGGETLAKTTNWRHACLGGEAIRSQLRLEFKRLGLSGLTMTNCYGPTEITAAATFHTMSLEAKDETPGETTVGKTLPNYSVCIVDSDNRPVTLGLSGEICIAGAGLALGYLNLPELTAEKFIPGVVGTDRMYRTGDIGRLTADGTLMLMGRLDGDTQVKLRGIRIELTEVEETLLKASKGSLLSVVVAVRGDALIAYATSLHGTSINANGTQHLLHNLPLPQYMRPSQLVLVDRFPMTSNGKIDRREMKQLPLTTSSSSVLHPDDSKLSLRQGELRLLWEKVLVTSPSLGPDTDFFFAGGNSVQLIKLQHAIKEAMGITVPTHELYHASTLRRMTAVVDLQRHQDKFYDENIDWAQETAVTNSMLKTIQSSNVERKDGTGRGGVEVLLTGATSFLGAAILETLIQDPTVSAIHCIAVLPDDRDKVAESSKVTIYTGSLSQPALGLNKTECADLQYCIDVVIHAGANGHCLNNYSSVRAPNLHSTQFLASLALAVSVPVLFLSSSRVTLFTGKTSLPPVSVATSHPPTTGAEGFTSAKWASETFLENLAAYTSVPIEVHRPCIAVGDNAPNSDALNAILRYSHLLKAVPSYENMAGYFDFKAVTEIARDISSAAIGLTTQAVPGKQRTGSTNNTVRFCHHSSNVKVSMDKIQGHLTQFYNCPFERLEIRTWISKAAEAGLAPLIATYLESLLEQGKTIQFPYLGETA